MEYFEMLSSKDLILLVHRHRALWDRLHSNYKDKETKENAWQQICTEIDSNFQTLDDSTKHQIISKIAKKWYNVRDSYVKAKKSRQTKPYVYKDILTFLDPIYDEKDPIEFAGKPEYITAPDEENFEEDIFVDFTEGVDPAKKGKYEEPNHREDLEESIVTVLANLIEKEEDEDRAFFKSITPAVKSLSEDSKFQFRIQVMKLIQSLKSKDKTIRLKLERVSEGDTE